MPLASGQVINLSALNPVLLALKYKSLATLKFLVERFGVRQAMQNATSPYVVVDERKNHPYYFKSLILPLLVEVGDNEALTFLLKQSGFAFTQGDLVSFIDFSLRKRWVQGLKTFLGSSVAHLVYSSLPFDE